MKNLDQIEKKRLSQAILSASREWCVCSIPRAQASEYSCVWRWIDDCDLTLKHLSEAHFVVKWWWTFRDSFSIFSRNLIRMATPNDPYAYDHIFSFLRTPYAVCLTAYGEMALGMITIHRELLSTNLRSHLEASGWAKSGFWVVSSMSTVPF